MTKKVKSGLKIKSSASWAKVKPDEGFIARGIPEELVGIEELRDYTLVKRSAKSGSIKKKKEAVVEAKKLKKKKDLIAKEWDVTETVEPGNAQFNYTIVALF